MRIGERGWREVCGPLENEHGELISASSYNSALPGAGGNNVFDIWRTLLLIIVIVTVSLAFLMLVYRLWPVEQRRPHNDLIGWQITVLGTTYAVIIGFMLYAVWTSFEVANGNAEAEANCLVNMVRSAQGLPDAQRQVIQDLAKEYVDLMLTEEWPAMGRVSVTYSSDSTLRKLWAAVTEAESRTSSEQTSRDHTFTELSKMTEHRRLRQLEVISDFPGILWSVLIAGAVVTIVSACLFGAANLKLHFIQVGALSLLVALILAAIADINRPFQGSVHVLPLGFESARDTLERLNWGKR
ncbi:MAG: DUF4239 domain-containing protein [Bryobacteraceae bacterium]